MERNVEFSLLLFYYIFLIFLAFVTALFNTNTRLSYFIFFLVFVGYSVLSRDRIPKNDILAYNSFMDIPLYAYKDIYFLREPVYWFSSKLLYEYFDNPFPVYLIIDIFSIAVFLFALYRNKYQAYFLYLFTVFFVSVLGFQNVYRQYLATFFILAAIFLIAENKFKTKVFTLILGFLTHNVVALYVPMLLATSKIKSIFRMILALIPLVVFLGVVASSKSNSETGDTNPILFIAVFIVTMMFYIALNKLRFAGKYLKYFYYYIYSLILIIVALPIFGQAQVKRIAMICLLISLFAIYDTIESKFKRENLIIVRVLFILFAISPILISSTLQDIINY